tara:strand:- start:340 stop:588 length:249 start_codon:yes stop_codon:yes gene_type:complete
MTVKILFFSLLREIVGKEEAELQVHFEPCTVGSILNQVYIQWPPLKDWDSSILISLDLDYVNREVEVVDGQVIALMPPLQGG